MGFLDDVINTTKSVAATAGKKTDEAVQLSRLKIKTAQLNSDIKNKFEKLGSLIYQMAKTDEKHNEEFDLLVGEIDDCYAMLDDIEAKIIELKKEVVCPGCGVRTKSENAYCPKCGTKLPVKEEPAEQPAEEPVAEQTAPAKPAEPELNKDKTE